MYSQCPQCQAIFNVPESHIGAHQGLVRCGRCQAIFHAVTNKVDGLEVLDERRAATGKPSEPEPSPAAERHQPAAPGPDSSANRALDTEREPSAAADVAAPDETGASLESTGPGVNLYEEDTFPGTYDDAADEETEGEQEPAEVAQQEPEEGDAPDRHENVETDEEREADRVELVVPSPGEAAAEDDHFTGEVEEIVIEAPPVLWNAFDEEVEDDVDNAADTSASATGGSGGAGAATTPRRVPAAAATRGAAASGERKLRLKSPYRARDVRMVELPHPRPFKTASLSLLSVFLVLLLVWQVKTFYLDALAQFPIARPYLEIVCRPLGCAMPPRRNFADIDLVGTSINVNPEVPGALQINASLMNRAHFPQPYPPLRVTLTDRDGRIVGRRTYLPSEYHPDGVSQLLPIKAKRDVSINLAQPAENAVGYEVELVAPVSGSSQ